jgi:hypothetical protein
MVVFVSQSASLDWLLFCTIWVVVLLIQTSRRRDRFRRRLDQLLLLLVPRTATQARRSFAGFKEQAMRNAASGVLRGSARRWRAQLGVLYAQGYQVASETISSPADVVHGGELIREVVAALKAERGGLGASVSTTDDPVIVLAYGLGAWPSGADLTSLEDLLRELGVSHHMMRTRFENLLRTIPTANENREFRELAGASFVLGASARIVEATLAPGSSAQPPGWVGALRRPRLR